jgi:hypothetical protein
MKSYIQELEAKKREYHNQEFKKKYPNGCFSIQIRYGKYGFDAVKGKERRIQLRWGIKTNSTHYWTKSFYVDENGNIETINNSFKYTWNYDNLKDLLKKCIKENVDKKLISLYKKELEKRR